MILSVAIFLLHPLTRVIFTLFLSLNVNSIILYRNGRAAIFLKGQEEVTWVLDILRLSLSSLPH